MSASISAGPQAATVGRTTSAAWRSTAAEAGPGGRGRRAGRPSSGRPTSSVAVPRGWTGSEPERAVASSMAAGATLVGGAEDGGPAFAAWAPAVAGSLPAGGAPSGTREPEPALARSGACDRSWSGSGPSEPDAAPPDPRPSRAGPPGSSRSRSARSSSRSTVSPCVRHGSSLTANASGRGPAHGSAMSQSKGSRPSPRSAASARISEASAPRPSPLGTRRSAATRSRSSRPSGDSPRTCSPSRICASLSSQR